MAFSKKWKPTAEQKRAYAEKMRESEEKFIFINSPYPIRLGCKVEYVDKSTNNIIVGEVIKSSYGAKTGQHTFTILDETGVKILVKGRNIYDRLLKHEAGEIAKNWNNRTDDDSISSANENIKCDVFHKVFGKGITKNIWTHTKTQCEGSTVYFIELNETKDIISSFLAKI